MTDQLNPSATEEVAYFRDQFENYANLAGHKFRFSYAMKNVANVGLTLIKHGATNEHLQRGIDTCRFLEQFTYYDPLTVDRVVLGSVVNCLEFQSETLEKFVQGDMKSAYNYADICARQTQQTLKYWLDPRTQGNATNNRYIILLSLEASHFALNLIQEAERRRATSAEQRED